MENFFFEDSIYFYILILFILMEFKLLENFFCRCLKPVQLYMSLTPETANNQDSRDLSFIIKV